jgi:hypothetical protein
MKHIKTYEGFNPFKGLSKFFNKLKDKPVEITLTMLSEVLEMLELEYENEDYSTTITPSLDVVGIRARPELLNIILKQTFDNENHLNSKERKSNSVDKLNNIILKRFKLKYGVDLSIKNTYGPSRPIGGGYSFETYLWLNNVEIDGNLDIR